MKQVSILIIALMGLVISCKKHETIPPISPDPIALKKFHSNHLKEATQTFTISSESANTVVGEKGFKLFIPADNFEDGAGNLVTGNIEIHLVEITNKTEMILMNKTTNGRKANGTYAPLISGGELYIEATQYGSPIYATNAITVSVPADEYTPEMRKFINVSETDDLLWEMASDSIIDIVEDSLDWKMYFEVFPDEWDWINCDYFSGDPGPFTTIDVELPEGFDYTNTAIHLSIDGINTLTYFYEEIEFPIGLDVHFIAIGIIDEEIHYVIQSSELTSDHVEVIEDFSVISSEALTDLIEDLP